MIMRMLNATDGGVIVAEAEDGSGFQDNTLHNRFLDRSVSAIELVDDCIGRAADDADEDFSLFQILGHIDGTDRHHPAIPFVIVLDPLSSGSGNQELGTSY